MRKLMTLILVCLFALSTAAVAEGFDLSGLSFEELVALKSEINLILFGSDQYKKVTVPAGDYVIGEDIPAGVYSLSCESGFAAITVYTNTDGGYDSLDTMHSLTEDKPVGKIELKDGYAVEITGSIVFETYTGLGF